MKQVKKIEELKKELNEAMGAIPAINNNNDKKYLDNKIKNLQGEGLKKDEDEIKSINAKVSEKCSIKEEQKHNLGYTGAYQPQGLNAVNQNITISQKTLKDAIANLADYDNNKQSETTKDDLVQLLFVTSEAMRFGSYTKYFNHYYKDKDNLTKSSTSKPQTTPPSTGTTDNQVEFKNIPTNVQEILDGKINSLKWKDYEPQLIGGWIAASKDLEQKRKEIFKQLNDLIIIYEFFSTNTQRLLKLNAILEQDQNRETNIVSKIRELIENSNNQEFKNLESDILNAFKNIYEINKKRNQEEKIDLQTWIGTFVLINTMIYKKYIFQNDPEIIELLIVKKPKILEEQDEIGLTYLHSATINNNLEVMTLLIDNAQELYQEQPEKFKEFINKKNYDGGSPLHYAAQNGYPTIVQLLLAHGAVVNATNNDGNTPLYVATYNGYLAIVKLLLEQLKQSKITFDNLTKNVQTASLIAEQNDKTEVVNLLNNFNELKEKIKLCNKLLQNTQDEEQKTKINNNLQETQKELETLLKPEAEAQSSGSDISDYSQTFAGLRNIFQQPKNETSSSRVSNGERAGTSGIQQPLSKNLSDVITQTELGEISDNSPQTIKDVLKDKNLNLNIDKINVIDIKQTTAVIISNDQSVYPDDAVKVTFTLAKKSAKPSKAQKTITEDKSNYGGFKPGFLNQATKSNNSSKRVSVDEQAETSSTQNQKTIITNHNNLYDVPADGSCLFWSVATSYLLPARNNNEEFRNRFIQLFGELQLSYLSYVQTLLQQFNLSNTNNFLQDWYQDATAHRLVRVVFRNHVVNYIERNLDNPIQSNANQAESFRGAIQISENEVVNNYLDRMRNINAWGGEIEILAMNNLLNANIGVGTDIPYQPVNQNSNNNNIAISYVGLEKNSGIHNHYNFALTSEEERTNHPIAIDDNQGNIPVVVTTNRQDNLPQTTPNPDANAIKLPVNDHGQHHIILSNNNKDDDSNHGNNIINSQISTTTKAINQYNALSKEEKLNEIKWN